MHLKDGKVVQALQPQVLQAWIRIQMCGMHCQQLLRLQAMAHDQSCCQPTAATASPTRFMFMSVPILGAAGVCGVVIWQC